MSKCVAYRVLLTLSCCVTSGLLAATPAALIPATQNAATAPAENLSKAPPILGWSSWSSTSSAGTGARLNETYITATADVMADKLKAFGYKYINLDDGWLQGLDDHGLPVADAQRFPSGIPALAEYVHKKGLKLGLYMVPGLRVTVSQGNGTVAGTTIPLKDIVDMTRKGNTQSRAPWNGYKIDYSKPGAKEYVQSQVDLFASWGVDYVKFDFVGPGGGNQKADTRDDIEQWRAAIQKNGRPIWLELSNSLSIDHIAVWKAASNGWRINGDIEYYQSHGKLTRWPLIARRFTDAPKWASFAGPGGWNDLDAVEIGNGENNGLTMDERKTVMTLWCISCSPLILGSNLTKLDSEDLPLLTNPEVLAVDQAGQVATPLSQATPQQVWRAKNPDGSYTVALFNLGGAEAKVAVTWKELSLDGPATVRDIWNAEDLGKFDTGFDTTLATHACRLLRVKP